MSNYEVKNIDVKSMFKNIPIVFAILGMVIGIFTFFIFPTEIARDLAFGAKLLSWLIFVVLYTLIMVVGLILVAWLYNVIATKFGGIALELGQKED